jgi:hypothetical protein
VSSWAERFLCSGPVAVNTRIGRSRGPPLRGFYYCVRGVYSCLVTLCWVSIFVTFLQLWCVL